MTALEALTHLSEIDDQMDSLHQAICYLETKDVFKEPVRVLRRLYVEKQTDHNRITKRLQDIVV